MFPCCQRKSAEELLDDITNKPQEVFAVDLLFVLSDDPKSLCLPECHEIYQIHPSSPLTEDIRLLIEKVYKRSPESYSFIQNIAKEGCTSEEDLFECFSGIIQNKLSHISYADEPLKVIFYRLVNVAKHTIEFYMGGTEGAFSYAVQRIVVALDECNEKHNGQIFQLLSNYASAALSELRRAV